MRGGLSDRNTCNLRRRRGESTGREAPGNNPALGPSVVVTAEADVVGFLALLDLAAALLVSK